MKYLILQALLLVALIFYGAKALGSTATINVEDDGSTVIVSGTASFPSCLDYELNGAFFIYYNGWSIMCHDKGQTSAACSSDPIDRCDLPAALLYAHIFS